MNYTNFYSQNFSGGNEPYKKTLTIEERDPSFTESPAAQITDADIEAWDQKMDGSDVEGFVSEDDLETTLSDYVNGAEYDSNSKKILLKNADNVIAEIDATDFIKDGMLENAEIKDGKLVLTFNADSGSEAVELSLTDIFNADNYYTKDDVDSAIQTYVNEEIGKIEIPSLTGYATEDYVDTEISKIEIPTVPTVPTNVSAFTNDAGYLISSDVANLATKSYVDDELAKKANASAIPTKLSQLTNDSGYITSYTETDPAFTSSAAWGALLAEIERLNNLNKILVERNADSAETISAMTSDDAANADIIVNSNSLNALSTPKTFNSINLVGGSVDSNNTVYLNANESVSVSDLTVDGTKGASGNGKINFSSSEMNVSDVTIADGSTVYNVFEGAQGNNNVGATDTFNATNVNADNTALKHNVFNIYKFNNNANVNVSDCDFNLDMANSNIMRISNVTNADNVTITFRNVNWTYENKGYTDADLKWAGLIIYQPYGTDAAFAGDLSHIATWTFNFINCKYNGVKVTENNFGSSNQVMYFYDINHEGGITDPTSVEGITINFE